MADIVAEALGKIERLWKDVSSGAGTSHAPATVLVGTAGNSAAVDANGGLSTIPEQGGVQRVSAGYMAPGQTAKTFVGKVALSATLTTTVALWTVTTGKNFLVTDIAVYSDAAALTDVQIQAAGTPIFRGQVRDLAPIQMPGMETQPQATSAQAVTLVFPAVAGPPNVTYTIQALEQ